MSKSHYGNEFSVPEHWDTQGIITANSDPAEQYKLWKEFTKDSSQGWHGREFELCDFERYIDKLKQEESDE